MKIEELKQALVRAEIECGSDWERLHSRHDDLLLEYINNKEVTEIFNRTTKWCA